MSRVANPEVQQKAQAAAVPAMSPVAMDLPPGTQTYSANWSVTNQDGTQVSVPVTVVPIGKMVNGQPVLSPGMEHFSNMVAQHLSGELGRSSILACQTAGAPKAKAAFFTMRW
jgi:hypothetical protein